MRPENGPFSWKVYSNLTSRPENRLISWPQVMSFLLRTGLRRWRSVLSFWTGLRRWRSVFLCPTTGYLTPKQKHLLHSQDFFFRAPASLTRASSRRSTGTRKKHSTIVECFCFGVIRTGFEPVTHSLEGCCSIQLSYRTSPFSSLSGVLMTKVGAKIMLFSGNPIVWILLIA